MSKFRIAALMFLAMPLAACGSGHLVVEQANRSSIRAQSIQLEAADSTTTVPEGALAYTQEKLEAALFGGDRPVFQRGGRDLTVRYRYISFDRGSRAGRWLAGPLGMGEAQMVLEAEFVDPSGTVVARVRGQGELSGGFFGGSSNSAIDKAVNEIARYARQQFGNRPSRQR
jgi:hypothetical protein